MNRILLIDGNSLTYRAYFGSIYSSYGIMKNENNIPINAVLTLRKMLEKAFRTYKPTHVFVAFDAGPKTFRHKKIKDYKGGRNKTPIELIVQFPIIKEMIDNIGLTRMEIELIEADDLIATLAVKHSKVGNKVLVLSSDKDLLQLVDKYTEVILPQNGYKKDKIINYKNFEEINGHGPLQVIDYKGLVGDPSDNLSGVKGLGPITANKLLKEYGNLEGIYKNIEDIKGAMKQKLIVSKEMAFLCRDVATLKFDVDIPGDLNYISKKEIKSEKMLKFLKKYQLESLM